MLGISKLPEITTSLLPLSKVDADSFWIWNANNQKQFSVTKFLGNK